MDCLIPDNLSRVDFNFVNQVSLKLAWSFLFLFTLMFIYSEHCTVLLCNVCKEEQKYSSYTYDDFNCTAIKCLHNNDLNVLAKNMFDLGTSSNNKGRN